MNPADAIGPRPRVVIVGGGLAGLAAAVALAPCGYAVTIVEARRQLGGRATSFRDNETDELVDHCQHVSLGCCTNWTEFCRATGLDELVRRDRSLHFFGPDGKQFDLRGVGWLPAPLHLAPGLLRLGYLSLRERLSIAIAMIRLARVRPRPDDPAEPSIGAWLRSIGQSERAIERFWTPVLVSALSESLDRASLAHARKVFVDGFLAARSAYEIEVPRVALGDLYGGRLTTWLARNGVEVLLGERCRQIAGDAGSVSGVELSDGRVLPAEHVVCAVPWRRCGELFGEETATALPWLSGLREIESAPITGVHLWFDREITPLPHAVLVERLSQWIFNKGETDPASGGRKPPEAVRDDHGTDHISANLPSPPAHYYQVVISASRDLAGRDREEVIAEVRRDLEAAFPQAREARLERWKIVTEQVAVFSVVPGMDRLRPRQQTTVRGLYLAGDWTATGWPSTMEGALRSGNLAAEAILAADGHGETVVTPDLSRALLTRAIAK